MKATIAPAGAPEEKTIRGIHPVHPAQLAQATEVIRESFATVAAEFGLTRQNCPTHTSFITDEALRAQCDAGWAMYGLYDDTRLVGVVSLSDEGDGVYKLHNLAVLPGHRRKGYGKQLLDFCKARAIELGGRKIAIGIIEENAVLKNWYAANGFVHTGTKIVERLPFTVGYMEWEG